MDYVPRWGLEPGSLVSEAIILPTLHHCEYEQKVDLLGSNRVIGKIYIEHSLLTALMMTKNKKKRPGRIGPFLKKMIILRKLGQTKELLYLYWKFTFLV